MIYKGKLQNKTSFGNWWLRSPNYNNDNNARNVNNDGNPNNNNNVNNTNNGVVPDLLFAIWRASEYISDYMLCANISKGTFPFPT